MKFFNVITIKDYFKIKVLICLQTFGVVFSISNAVLGLTLLAWGNSIGGLCTS